MKKNQLLLWVISLLIFGCSDRKFNNPDDPESDAYDAPPIFITTVADVQDTIFEGVLWKDTLNAEDPEAGPLSFEMVTSPSAGASLTDNIVAWQPDAGSTGDYTIAFTVTDSQGKKDTLTWILTVISPVISPPTQLTATDVSLTDITLTWTDATDYESNYEITWTASGITGTDTLPANSETFTIQTDFLANRAYTISITAFSSAAASDPSTLEIMTPQDLVKKTAYLSDSTGSISFFRSAASSNFDSLYCQVHLNAPLAAGDGLYLWSSAPVPAGQNPNPELEGIFTAGPDSIHAITVIAPAPLSWTGPWNDTYKSVFSVSVEGPFPGDSLPTTILYTTSIDTSWHRGYSELMEKAPADLSSAGLSLVEAVTATMVHIWNHANLIPSEYSTHAKHVHNMLNGSDHMLAEYASAGVPSSDKNGPVIYLPAIRQRLSSMKDNYPAGSDLLLRTNSYLAAMDEIITLTGEAVEWAQIIIESSADQAEATSTNGAELLPRLQVMKTANPDAVSPISTTVFGVDTFDSLFSDLGVFDLDKAP